MAGPGLGSPAEVVDSVGAILLMSPDSDHGQKFKATIVKTVSNEFDRVLVEQNHCQGLSTLINNYQSQYPMLLRE